MTPEELMNKIAGRRVIASISGGKDSAAMSLYLRELGIEHDRVFFDTGWEHPATYEYLRGELTREIGSIVELQAKFPAIDTSAITRPRVRAAVEAGNAMVIACLQKAMFPSRVIRFCTQDLKVFPMQAYISTRVEAGEEVINAVGIRRAESDARAKMSEWEWSDGFDCEVWRPLVDWSEQEVIEIHARHGLRPNPLYLQGATRVGCWPCIFARKAEVRMLGDTDEERVALIDELEQELTQRARARAEESGAKLSFERTWFQQFKGRSREQLWPIRRMVEWSRTTRGGRVQDMQVALFSQADDGCMRWGLCETISLGSTPSSEDE
jgi:3'-phosphoadenosine 5'-phosphosulfate sulfotransferase (PAPS reductase)/FAD synthetase